MTRVNLLWSVVASIPLAFAISIALPLAQAKPTPTAPSSSPPVTPPKTPTAPTGPSEVNQGPMTISTSMVSPGSDVARRWITPVMEWDQYENNDKSSTAFGVRHRQSRVVLINVDTKSSLTVRIVCYGENGAPLASTRPKEHTLAPRAFARVLPPLPAGIQQWGWCTIDAPRPVVAYGEWMESLVTRSSSDRAEEVMVPFFKAEP